MRHRYNDQPFTINAEDDRERKPVKRKPPMAIIELFANARRIAQQSCKPLDVGQ